MSGEESPAQRERLTLAMATADDREAIYRIRHDVYARELGQHPTNRDGRLTDSLDAYNVYLVARLGDALAGFVSITPPGHPAYSVDKYMPRAELPFPCDGGLYEVRLLTVTGDFRGLPVAGLLMYAALRWIEAQGGTRIVAIGRQEVLSIYLKAGLSPLGRQFQSGAVTYELLSAALPDLRTQLSRYSATLQKLEGRIEWCLPVPFHPQDTCFHGGAFFEEVGEEFDRLSDRDRVINGDVLDAWFPPSPQVVDSLREHLPWLLRTSPPTRSEGLIQVIARARGVEPDCILPGAGSSDLIFLAFREWLAPGSRALLLDPTYGEYPHVLENVVGCRVDRLPLRREEGYTLNPARLADCLAEGYDLVALVNPNSPTGRHVPRETLETVLAGAPKKTRLWIDETYLEYVGPDQSLERFAAGSRNAIVCKSMSKVYALSGARAAYLCGPAALLTPLRRSTPPWSVSLLAQVAAVKVLQDPEYYVARYAETRALREALADALRQLGLEVVPGTANFLLAHLPESAPTAAEVLRRCRAEGLFLRDAGEISRRLGTRALRLAVKDAATNERALAILARALA